MKNLIATLPENEKREILKSLVDSDQQLTAEQKADIMEKIEGKISNFQIQSDIKRLGNSF